MKVTYVEAADTWVISHVSAEEMDKAKRMANRYNGHGIKTIVVPDGFGIIKKYKNESENFVEYDDCIRRTEVGIPISNPKIANDLRLITSVLDNADEYGSIFVLIDEKKFETDLEVLCTSLQLLGIGCDIRKSGNGKRALQIFNKKGINL